MTEKSDLKHARKTLEQAAVKDNVTLLALGAAVLSLLCGAQLLRPVDTFTAYSTYAMLRFIPEVVWGGALVVIAAIKLYIIFVGRRLRQKRYLWVGALTAFGLCLIWAAIFMVALVEDPRGIGFILYCGLSVSCFWVGVRRVAEL